MVSSSPRVLPSSTWLKLLHHYNQVQGEKGGGRQWFPFFKIKKNFFFFWLRWVFIAARGLSLVVASGGYSSVWCVGFSLQWLLLLRSLACRLSSCGMWDLPRLSCSAACAIFPDQGSNLCPLHWQADSYPLRHQGSPQWFPFKEMTWKSHKLLLFTFHQPHQLYDHTWLQGRLGNIISSQVAMCSTKLQGRGFC